MSMLNKLHNLPIPRLVLKLAYWAVPMRFLFSLLRVKQCSHSCNISGRMCMKIIMVLI